VEIKGKNMGKSADAGIVGENEVVKVENCGK